MSTALDALHVVLAILVIGPLVVAPFAARRAIARRSGDGIRFAANQLALFGAGSLLVAGSGVATVLAGDEWTMVTPWVLVSSTLFVVALGMIWGYAVPALRKAAQLADGAALTGAAAAAEAEARPAEAEAGAPDRSVEDDGAAANPPAVSDRDERASQRLDRISARIVGAGWLLLVTFAAITVLMTVRPFS